MKTIQLFILSIFISGIVHGQAIVNIVLLGDKGETEDIKATKYFIVIKAFPGTVFQRLEYKMHAPMQKLKTYGDSLLEVLNGDYLEYAGNGSLYIKGYYTNNLKDKDWYYYNDTCKVVLQQKYSNGNFLKAIDPDTVAKQPHDDKLKEVDAGYPGGDNAWMKYLQAKLLKGSAAEGSLRGGKVMVNFSVDTTGQVQDIVISKSAEFVLDEEALRVITESPKWKPAIQGDRHVRAYRRQPLTFIKQED